MRALFGSLLSSSKQMVLSRATTRDSPTEVCPIPLPACREGEFDAPDFRTVTHPDAMAGQRGAMKRLRKYDALQVGQFALIASIASLLFIVLWFALGHGRSGSLSDCIVGGETVRTVIGWIAWAAVSATAVLTVISLFTSSRWWGLSGVGLILISLPIIMVIVFVTMAGDPGGEPGICQT